MTARATRREWIGLTVIALPCLLYSMDLTVLNLATPHLSADLRPSASQLLWIVDIYGFLLAGCLITMGTLGDRIGRRRLLLIGACAFGGASILAALSTSAEMLIIARAILGIAAATLAPSTLSLIRNMFLDPHQRTLAIGVWIASFSAGGALGPLVGGALLAHFWWGSVFLLAVPVMILLLALAPVFLPEFRDPDAGRLDIRSAALSLASVLPVIYGVKRIAEDGVAMAALLVIAAGALFGVVFVRRQRKLENPMIDLRLFRRPAFSASLAINMLSFFAAFAAFFLIAQYLQLVLGMEPLEAGFWTMPSGLAFVLGSMLTPKLAQRADPAFVMAAGLAVGSAGFALLSQLDGHAGVGLVVTGFVILSLGLAPVFTLTTDLIVGTAPAERAGMASGLSETSSELGGALGIAMLGSVVTAVYRTRLVDAAPGAAEAARHTLGGAAETARHLPESLGEALLRLARAAFTDGLQLAAVISAVLLLVLAILAVTFLRPAQRAAAPGASTEAVS